MFMLQKVDAVIYFLQHENLLRAQYGQCSFFLQLVVQQMLRSNRGCLLPAVLPSPHATNFLMSQKVETARVLSAGFTKLKFQD